VYPTVGVDMEKGQIMETLLTDMMTLPIQSANTVRQLQIIILKEESAVH
jgi:hypothetical protein